MAYLYSQEHGRQKQELYAFDVFRRVVKGKGKRQATFYLAMQPGSGEIVLVLERMIKDRTGAKALARGRKLKKQISAVQYASGVMRYDEATGRVCFDLALKVGNRKLLHKQLWKEFERRSRLDPSDPDHSPIGARFSRLLKRTGFNDESGDEEADGAQEELGPAIAEDDADLLTEDELTALGLDRSDQAELDQLEDALVDQLATLRERVIADLRGQDEPAAVERARERATEDLQRLRTTLRDRGTATLEKTDQQKILAQVEVQLDGIRELESRGPYPLGERPGDVVDATPALLAVMRAQSGHLHRLMGTRTAGIETEYHPGVISNLATDYPCPTCGSRAHTACKRPCEPRVQAADPDGWRSIPCPTCKAKKGKVCKRQAWCPWRVRYAGSTSKRELLAVECRTCDADQGQNCNRVLCGARREAAELPDHTPLFTLTRQPDDELLCQWMFETQGEGAKTTGCLEAVSQPFKSEDPDGELRRMWIAEAIRAVFTARSGGLGGQSPQSVVRAVQPILEAFKGSLDVPSFDVSFAVAPGVPDQLKLAKSNDMSPSPQVNVTHSLAVLHETFAKGYPVGIARNEPMFKSNMAMMQDAAADGAEIYAALAGDEKTSTIGHSLEGFLTLIAQTAHRIALEMVNTDTDSRGGKGIYVSRSGEPVERIWRWDKDRFPMMVKMPLARIAQEGGLTSAELALLRDKLPELKQQVERIIRRIKPDYDPDEDDEDADILHVSVEAYLEDVVEPKPKAPKARYEPWPPGTPHHDHLVKSWKRTESEQRAFEAWAPAHEQEFEEWRRIQNKDFKRAIREIRWHDKQHKIFGYIAGDGGVHEIHQVEEATAPCAARAGLQEPCPRCGVSAGAACRLVCELRVEAAKDPDRALTTVKCLGCNARKGHPCHRLRVATEYRELTRETTVDVTVTVLDHLREAELEQQRRALAELL